MTQKLPTTVFIITLLLILGLGLGSVFWLHSIFYPKIENKIGFKGGPVTSAPASLILDIDSPDDDLLTFSSSVAVSGKTLPHLNILITTDKEDLIIESKSDGSFNTDLNLSPGVNEISMVVFEGGDSREIKRTIYYSKEKI